MNGSKISRFQTAKARERKTDSEFFFDIHIRMPYRFDQANKKKTVMYTLRKVVYNARKMSILLNCSNISMQQWHFKETVVLISDMRFSQETLVGRIVAISGYPWCVN